MPFLEANKKQTKTDKIKQSTLKSFDVISKHAIMTDKALKIADYIEENGTEDYRHGRSSYGFSGQGHILTDHLLEYNIAKTNYTLARKEFSELLQKEQKENEQKENADSARPEASGASAQRNGNEG